MKKILMLLMVFFVMSFMTVSAVDKVSNEKQVVSFVLDVGSPVVAFTEDILKVPMNAILQFILFTFVAGVIFRKILYESRKLKGSPLDKQREITTVGDHIPIAC